MLRLGTAIDPLKKLLRKDGGRVAAEGLLAAILWRKDKSIRHMAGILDRAATAVRMHEKGLDGRHHGRHPGAPCRLGGEQLDELAGAPAAGPAD